MIPMRPIASALRVAAKLSVTRPKSVLFFSAVLTLAALGSASRLELSVDILETVPEGIPVAATLRSIENYGSIEPLILAISGSEKNLGDRLDLAADLMVRLDSLEEVESVNQNVFANPMTLLDEGLLDSMLLLVPPEDITRLGAILEPEQIDLRVADNYRRLQSPLAPLNEVAIAEDPLGMLSLLRLSVGRVDGDPTLRTRDGILTTEDGRFVLVLVRPAGSPRDLEFATALHDGIAAEVVATMDELGLQGSVGVGLLADEDPEAESLTVGMTGHSAMVMDYRDLLGRDVRNISGIGFAAVLVLFLLAFKRPGPLIIAGVPLAVGVVWTLGISAVVLGRIDALTAAVVPILCGLAIDFTIHLYNRYLEETHEGHEMLSAFTTTHGTAGVGIVAAAMTTTWAFFAMSLADLPGPRDLGLICSIGIPVCLVSVQTVRRLRISRECLHRSSSPSHTSARS